MPIDREMLEDFRSIGYLDNCGMACDSPLPFHASQVRSWKEAIGAYDEAWSTLKDRRYYDISLLLGEIDRRNYNATWNKTVSDAKIGIAEVVQEKLSRLQVADKILRYIKSDLLCILIEQSYAIPGPDFPSFYRNLYSVYRLGHFPCGWEGGEYPGGHLVYF